MIKKRGWGRPEYKVAFAAPTLLRLFPPMTTKNYAILLDAGFVRKRLSPALGKGALVTADDIVRCVEGIQKRLAEEMRGFPPLSLYRVFYYDGEPYDKAVKSPLSGGNRKEEARREANQSQRQDHKRTAKAPVFRGASRARRASRRLANSLFGV